MTETSDTLTCYRIHDPAPRIVPAQSTRSWMDDSDQRFAYRCLPLTIANSMGWEVLCPAHINAEWNGGADVDDLTVEIADPYWSQDRIAHSHFGHGILTFHPGYLFRTGHGIGVWARGSPNRLKDGIGPLDGIVETDWLDFTFTMNWQFTRPGTVSFEKDEPFCFITLIGYRSMDSVQPKIMAMKDDEEILARFNDWKTARDDFNEGLAKDDPAIVKQKWQKWYTRGQSMSGDLANPLHVSKLRLADPKLVGSAAEPPASDAVSDLKTDV